MGERRKLLSVLQGHNVKPFPTWIMRQAGRYLPEYRQVRKEAGSFLDLCYTPEFSIEVTMQPIRRFGFDAAILFSDILVVPDALGQDVRFEEGVGPVLGPLPDNLFEAYNAEDFIDYLEPVFEAVRGIRSELPDDVTLLGFCGSPWTVATYMVGGKGSPDQAKARLFARHYPEKFEKLLDLLVEVSSLYLIRQLEAGADALQVFESWGGSLTPYDFEQYVLKPTQRIVERVRQEKPDALFIGFPKGAGLKIADYALQTGVNGVGIDWTQPVSSVRSLIGSKIATQGNIDPLLMVTGGRALDEAVDKLLAEVDNTPHIINLGHGITPDGKAEHVEQLLKRVRG